MLVSMIGRLHTVVLDCRDPAALATFYSALLGLPVTRTDSDWAVVGGGELPRLAFQRARDHQPPVWREASRPQQFHLDVQVDDIEIAEQQVLALGAVRLPGEGLDPRDRFRVYADPAGHPFCLEFKE
jgi:catechol 2,3-dioxygenase-like lactoylglutathione lyase family enzyme